MPSKQIIRVVVIFIGIECKQVKGKKPKMGIHSESDAERKGGRCDKPGSVREFRVGKGRIGQVFEFFNFKTDRQCNFEHRRPQVVLPAHPRHHFDGAGFYFANLSVDSGKITVNSLADPHVRADVGFGTPAGQPAMKKALGKNARFPGFARDGAIIIAVVVGKEKIGLHPEMVVQIEGAFHRKGEALELRIKPLQGNARLNHEVIGFPKRGVFYVLRFQTRQK